MTSDSGPVEVRDRRAADLGVLLPILRRAHEREGYPVRASAVRADWLAAPGELDAVVAVADGRVVGHVALHAADPEEDPETVRQWVRAVGRPPDGLAVVSRLFTDRSVRGAGTALLAEAVERAERLARVAVLLVDPDSPARQFYLRRGWQLVGTATQQWGHRTVEAALLVPPGVGVDPGQTGAVSQTGPEAAFSFAGSLVEWRGPAPHHFVAVPPELVEELADIAAEVTYGWGMVPVEVRIDRFVWETSLWPRDGGYLVPIRAEVRRGLGLEVDDVVSVRFRIVPRDDRPLDPSTGAPRRQRPVEQIVNDQAD